MKRISCIMVLFMVVLLCNNLILVGKIEAKEIRKIVTIDSGHGTKFSRSGADGEKKYAMIISIILKEKLEKEGVLVFMTHEKTDKSEFMGKNYNEDNMNRALFANEKNSDLYFRIHFDEPKGKAAVYYPEKHSDKELALKSKRASEIILKNIVEVMKASGEKYSKNILTDNDTLVGRENNGVLTGSKYSEKPTVLAELLPLSKTAVVWIEKKENQEKYAESLKNGIMEYLKK